MRSNERASLLYDGAYTLAMRIVNAVAAAATGVLSARLLGAAGRGIYALPIVEAGLVTAAFTGLMSATSYFMLNRGAGRTLLQSAGIAALLLTGAGSVVVIALAAIGHALWVALAAIASLPATAVVNVFSGYAIGTKRVRRVTTITVATTLATLLLMGIGLVLVGRTPWVAIAAWLVATNAVAAVAWCAMLAHARTLPEGSPVHLREYLRFTAKAAGVGLVTTLNYRGDLYVVALLASTSALGIYTVAVSASTTLLIATQAASIVVSPHIGALDRTSAAALTARCVRNNLLVALVLCGVLFLCVQPIVKLLYGAQFMPLVPVLRVLLFGVVASSLGSPLASYFTLKLGKPEVPLRLSSLSAAICIAFSALLVPVLGILGAAIASSAAYVVGQSAATLLFARDSRVRLRDLLLPTLSDAAFYVRATRRMVTDGHRLLFGGPPA